MTVVRGGAEEDGCVHTIPPTHPPRHWGSQSSHTPELPFWSIPLLPGDWTMTLQLATHLLLYT